MASPRGFVIKHPVITIDDTDLSDEVRQVRVAPTQPAVESTAAGAEGSESAPGIRSDSFTVRFRQQFGAGAVDEKLWGLFDGEEEFAVTVKPFNDTVSGTNPLYSGTCFIENYSPIDGDIGSLSETDVTFPVQGKISRTTSP